MRMNIFLLDRTLQFIDDEFFIKDFSFGKSFFKLFYNVLLKYKILKYERNFFYLILDINTLERI